MPVSGSLVSHEELGLQEIDVVGGRVLDQATVFAPPALALRNFAQSGRMARVLALEHDNSEPTRSVVRVDGLGGE